MRLIDETDARRPDNPISVDGERIENRTVKSDVLEGIAKADCQPIQRSSASVKGNWAA